MNTDHIPSREQSPRRSAKTEAAYLQAFGEFERWCEKWGESSLPASTEDIRGYLCDMSSEGRTDNSKRVAVNAIMAMHDRFGLERPARPPVKRNSGPQSLAEMISAALEDMARMYGAGLKTDPWGR